MEMNKISEQVDSWITQEELPVRAGLKEIKPAFAVLFDEDTELSGEELELENQAYYEFIQWCMSREHQVLMSVPKPEHNSDFYLPIETDDSISFAFGSADFLRLHGREFNVEQWKIRQLYERVKDLGQTYSVITVDKEIGRRNTLRKFLELVSDAKPEVRIKCFQIWNQHAYERDTQYGKHGRIGRNENRKGYGRV